MFSSTTLSVSTLFVVDDNIIIKCEVVSGIRSGRGNSSTGRKPAPMPFCQVETPRRFEN
jgi:hypothetical protein